MTNQEKLNARCKEMFLYGTITSDIDIEGNDGFHRMTTITYENKKFMLHKFNGECIEIFEI